MVNQRHHNDEFDDDQWSGEEAYDDQIEDENSIEDETEYEDPESEEPTRPCPYCRRLIHEDSQRCYYCEQYISCEDAPAERRPWWLWLGVALCLYAILRWFL